MTATGSNRNVSVACAAAKAELLFLRMTGSDELGRLSRYHVQMLSTSNDIAPSQMLGQDMSVSLALPAGGTREFNGIVTLFRMTAAGDQRYGRMARYEAIVAPRLWLLTRGAHCRFFHAKTVTEIVTGVLAEYHVDVSNQCWGSYPALEHCAQYRETDFAFVSRLMEREGIYYFFEHKGGKHTMVLADNVAVHAAIPRYAALPYVETDARTRDEETVYEWRTGGELQTSFYEVNDYDFEKPATSLQQGMLSRATRAQVDDVPRFTVQEHLSGHLWPPDGERYARIGAEIHEARSDSIEGRSSVRGIWPGGLITLEHHRLAAQNASFLVTAARYEINSDTYVSSRRQTPELPFFDCAFAAQRKDRPFRSERLTPRAVVGGLQTATVVGPDGEEISTDRYGRIKVQFHWEQFDPPNVAEERAKRCWVRVAHDWAGKTWGTFFVPRIGQEVIVSFIEGDPDRPLVTGCVYNANTMPPYALPDNAALSTLKSNSTKGGGGYNEMRFNDQKGSEQLFFHAQKEHETWVIHDMLANVGHDRHLKVTNDEYRSVGGARHDRVSGDENAQVDGVASLKVGQKLQQKVGTDWAIDAGMNVHIKAGMNVVIEAGVSITLKAGGAFVVVGPASVAVSGEPILLNSGGSAGEGDGASPMPPTAPTDADDGTKKLK